MGTQDKSDAMGAKNILGSHLGCHGFANFTFNYDYAGIKGTLKFISGHAQVHF